MPNETPDFSGRFPNLTQKASNLTSRKFLTAGATSTYLFQAGKPLWGALVAAGYVALQGALDALETRYKHNVYVAQLSAFVESLLPEPEGEEPDDDSTWTVGGGHIVGLTDPQIEEVEYDPVPNARILRPDFGFQPPKGEA